VRSVQPRGKTLYVLILTVKMETRHPIGGSIGSEFSASVITAELGWPEVARRGNFVSNFRVFFGKTTPYVNVFKILFGKFTWRHQSTMLCSNVVKFAGWETGEIVRYSHDKKNFGSLSNCRYCSRPKSATASPNIWLTLFQISSK